MAPKKHQRQSLPPKPSAQPARGYNDARAAAPSHKKHTSSAAGGGHWVYGWHAVNAALANPERVVTRIIASPVAAEKLEMPARKLPNPHIMEPRELDRILGNEAVHQGIAAEVKPLEPYRIEDILSIHNPTGPLVILDQVSDPHNVGAIMRSAAAYNAMAVIYPKDHSAPETATMAKAASGALDIVKRIQVTNLATTMRELKDAGWWIIGLEGEATTLLTDIKFTAKTVIVLGAEGKGMRRLTADNCDERARLPMGAGMESLNVSNAAAIALYQLYISKGR
jgi:23S rRNA (guanosine2251-2'-O)-methyltransferase